MTKHTMSTADVARELGLSVERIRQLDEDLCPVRLGSRHRRYDPKIVERVARQRSAEAAA